MATPEQAVAVIELHAFGNRTDVQTVYTKEAGYDVIHTDPYELRHALDNAYITNVSIQAVASFIVTSGTAGEITFTWDDDLNNPNNIESYAIYIWSSALQDGRYFYTQNDATTSTYIFTVTGLDTGAEYEVEIQAEPYADGIVTPKTVATNSPITVS